MTTISFLVPDSLKEWVQNQIDRGKYADTGEYLSELILRDQEREKKLAALQDAITQGINSGPAGDLDIADIKRRARRQRAT